jgi:hypothetical protein
MEQQPTEVVQFKSEQTPGQLCLLEVFTAQPFVLMDYFLLGAVMVTAD